MKQEAPVLAIVDDDPMLVESLGDLLESVGYRVCSFASAHALLDSDRFMQFACIITDIDIPLVDGFELGDRAHARRPELPVIFITGKSDMAGQGRVAGLAPGRFFQKPFDSQALLAAVAASIDER